MSYRAPKDVATALMSGDEAAAAAAKIKVAAGAGAPTSKRSTKFESITANEKIPSRPGQARRPDRRLQRQVRR